MFHIFYNNSTIRYSSYINKQWYYIQSRYSTDYNRINEYYRTRVSPVENDHILNKIMLHILKSLPNSVIDEITAMAHIDVVTDSISRQFKVSSISSKGRVLNNGLYKGSRDLLVYTEFDIPFTINDEWMDWSPVKFIHHTDTTIDLVPPNTSIKSDNLYMYYIDYKLMYRQYRNWTIQRGELSKDTRLYISQCVLPNMMKSLIDISIVNRYINSFNNTVNTPIHTSSPIMLSNYTSKVTRLITDDLNKLRGKNISYIELLQNIPTIFMSTAYNTLYLNDYLYNNNNKFVLYVSRISIVRFLFQLLGDRGISSNSALLNLLQTEILMLQNGKDLTHLPEDIQVDIATILDDIEFM